MEQVIFQTSLIASFIAGMVALFAPCCITFLLPAYLGSVFKEKEKIVLMTLVFGLGIFVVLLPAVLGVTLVSALLFRYHDTIYLLSSFVMLAVALTTLLGLKLPMPSFSRKAGVDKPDIFSIFTLGVFSGLTSACCAPVLIGILALTFLSPNFFGALFIGGMYVFGMVTPLLVISLFLSGRMPKAAVLRRPLGSFKFFGKEYPIIMNNIISFLLFFTIGILTLILTLSGRLSQTDMDKTAKTIGGIGEVVNKAVGGNLLFNFIFLIIVGFLIYRLAKEL